MTPLRRRLAAFMREDCVQQIRLMGQRTSDGMACDGDVVPRGYPEYLTSMVAAAAHLLPGYFICEDHVSPEDHGPPGKILAYLRQSGLISNIATSLQHRQVSHSL